MFNLRIRGPSGAKTIKISPDATSEDLYRLISSEVDIPKANLEVRFGFPKPQLISTKDLDVTVASLGIQNGETLQASSGSTMTITESTLAAPNTPLSKPTQRDNMPRAPLKSSLSSAIHLSDQTIASPSTSKSQNLESSLNSVSASVTIDSGHLILRVIPDDNSCLFRAVGLLLGNSYKPNIDISKRFREIVADKVKNDPINWCEPILGKDPNLYIKKILDENVWGGAIELAILAEHFKTEICSIDVQTGRVDRFGESENYPNRIFLIYSGIHYDAITLSPIPANELPKSIEFPPEIGFDTTIFSIDDESILQGSLLLVNQLRQQHYFTDTTSFTLRCDVCKIALVGEKDARQHAELTGHTQFGEYV